MFFCQMKQLLQYRFVVIELITGEGRIELPNCNIKTVNGRCVA